MTISREQRHVLFEKIRCFYHSRTLLLILVSFGILAYSSQYIFNRSLWVDEALVAIKIIDSSSYAEFFQPSESPIGFLVAERFLFRLFGDSEYVLRIIPFLSGILALLLFLKVTPYFIRPAAVPIALIFFVTLGQLIYYSSALKQYSSDVFITLLLYAIVVNILSQRPTILRILILGIIGAWAIWFSHPAMLVLAGVGGYITLVWLIEKKWANMAIMTIAYAFWIMSFIVLYLISLRIAVDYGPGQQVWAKHFMPLPPSSLADIVWFIGTFFDTVGYAIGISVLEPFIGLIGQIWDIIGSLLGLSLSVGLSLPEIIRILFSNAALLTLELIAGCMLLAGWVSIFSRNKKKFLLLIAPILVTLLSSGFQKYPFGNRVILFIVPTIHMFLGEGAIWIKEKISGRALLIGCVLIGVVCAHPTRQAVYSLIHPRKHEEARPVLRYLKEHKQERDILYVYYASQGVFKYYARRLGLDANNYIAGIMSREDWRKYIKDLQQLRGNKRVWLFFSHAYSEEAFFLYYLDSIGKRLDSFKDVRASVYLYDLR